MWNIKVQAIVGFFFLFVNETKLVKKYRHEDTLRIFWNIRTQNAFRYCQIDFLFCQIDFYLGQIEFELRHFDFRLCRNDLKNVHFPGLRNVGILTLTKFQSLKNLWKRSNFALWNNICVLQIWLSQITIRFLAKNAILYPIVLYSMPRFKSMRQKRKWKWWSQNSIWWK